MKVGDLVIPIDSTWAPDPDMTSIKYLNEHKGSGVILKVLSAGSHRKQNSYEIYWADTVTISWHTQCNLALLNP